MKIIQYNGSPQAWNDFVIANSSPASFLQSWEWGEFNQKILGHKIMRWHVLNKDSQTLALGLTIQKPLLMGKHFYYCPRGMICWQQCLPNWPEVLGRIINLIKSWQTQSIFVRFSPPKEFVDYQDGLLSRLGLVKPRILTHLKEPNKTCILDLKLNQGDLLKNMHSKTRYNIRLAERKGIKVRHLTQTTKRTNLETFFNLTKQTQARDKIKVYAKSYYQKLFDYFVVDALVDFKKMSAKLYLAEYQGKPLSSIMVVYFGDTATYLFGASSNANRNLMPNHLIQWQAIKSAQQAGLKYYDFWGISETNPKWAGITRFKKGFGGKVVRYLDTWDLVLNKTWYYLFFILKNIKKIIPPR